MTVIFFSLGFLLGIFVSLVLVLTVPSIGQVIFNKFFSSVKQELVTRSEEIINEKKIRKIRVLKAF